MDLEELRTALPESHRRHLEPDGPAPMRMMAAKGMAPLPPREMVLVLCGLGADVDEKLAATARETLTSLPDSLLGPVVEGDLPPAALLAVTEVLTLVEPESLRHGVFERLVLNRSTPDEAVAQIAVVANQRVAEIVVENQERCLRSRAIVDSIRKNSRVLRSNLDRLFDFLVRSGVLYDEMAETAEAMARLSPAQMQAMAERVELPDDAKALLEDREDEDARAEEVVQTLDKRHVGEEERDQRVPMLKLINSLKTSQKVALAMKGNKEARAILVRDHNKLVAGAAIRSPRVTESEVVAAAKSRSVSEEVVRIVSNSKEMTRPYQVKKALVYNPKTPLPVSMRFLTLLRSHDLKDVAKSKNIPSAVAAQAKRLLARKK